jgi:GR25 family glycosyltransferase involved in LPS biosynthesis
MSLLKDTHAEYVNLDARPERRERMEHELKRVKIQAERRRGLLPSEVKINPARIKGMWERKQKGAIGCHFSQVAVMKEAMRRKKHALVMEDDLVFCMDLQERLQEIELFMDKNPWDVFWLGGTFHMGKPWWHKKPNPERGCVPLGKDAERVPGWPRFFRTYGCFCTYAYIVNAKSIGKILAMFEERLPESIGIDHMFIMLQPKLNTFAFVPGSVKQYDHVSDIGVDRHGRPDTTTFSNFAKLNGTYENSTYWFADWINQFDPDTFNWNEAAR